LYVKSWFGLARVLFLARNYDESVALARRALELSPNHDIALSQLADGLSMLGKGAEAIAAAQRIRDPGWRSVALVFALAGAGERAGAVKELAKFEASNAIEFATQYGMCHALLGDVSEALTWLERARDLHDSGILDMGVDPVFDKMRDEPRFRALLESIKLPAVIQVR